MLDTPGALTPRRATFHVLALIGILLGLGFCVGLVIGASHAIAQLRGGTAPAAATQTPALTGIMNTVTFAIGLVLVLRQTGTRWTKLVKIRGAAPAIFAAAAVAVVGLGIVNSDLSNVVERVAPVPGFLRTTFAPLRDLASYPISGPLLLVVIAPVTEELFFRGAILRGLLATVSMPRAIVVSALLFMVFHLNPWQFPIALLMGLLLGWLYARTRSLALCLFCHALNNGTSLLAEGLPFQIPGYNTPHADNVVLMQPWWFDVIGLALLIGAVGGLARLMPQSAAPVTPKAADAVQSVAAN